MKTSRSKQTKHLNRNHFILIFTLYLLALISCTKDDDLAVPNPCPGELPCIGINDSDEFIAAYANGVPWVSRSAASFAGIHEINSRYNEANKYLNLAAVREYDEFSDKIGFGFNIIEKGKFEIEFGDWHNYRDYNSPCINVDNGSYKWYGDSTAANYVEVTLLDFDKQIVEGKFELTVINSSCQDTIRFTEGVFSNFFFYD